uniref:Uncharacterized protein n=1 Tax=viral metagenome TaxID=1070528 RepID=A0A6H2A6H9_9ZZZZ
MIKYRLIFTAKRTKKKYRSPFVYTLQQADEKLKAFTLNKGVQKKVGRSKYPIEAVWKEDYGQYAGADFDFFVRRAKKAWGKSREK